MKDLTGEIISRLTVIKMVSPPSDKRNSRWLCRCVCGKEITVQLGNLTNGHTKSCGCIRVKHGRRRVGMRDRTYQSWDHMVQRCTNPGNDAWKYYGELGVKVCQRWLKFENFLEDMGVRPNDTSLDRIDPWGNYEPKNCRWASREIQSYNKRYVKMVQVGNKLVHPLIARGLVKEL